MTDPSIFNQIIVWPIINLLMVFYKPLSFLGAPGALGFAIILLTAAVRLALYPLSLKQLRSAQKMQKLKPKIDKLAKKHKDKKKLQKEQLKLYQKHGVNPAAGCLPTLMQFPVLIGLYRVFLYVLGNGASANVVSKINKVVYISLLKINELETNFFGFSLGIKPSSWKENGAILLLIPLATAAFSYWRTKTMEPAVEKNKKTPSRKLRNQAGKQEHESKKTKRQKNSDEEEDFASVMQGQMKFMFPLMIGWLSYSFPIGLALYWNTFTAFGILQQLHVNKEVGD